MKKGKGKLQIMLILILAALSVLLAYKVPWLVQGKSVAASGLAEDEGGENSLLDQKISGVRDVPHTVTKVYLRNNLLGVLNDKTVLNKEMAAVYKRDYETKFPNTQLGLGEDVYTVDLISYYEYENIDSDLVSYLEDNNLFSIVTNKISFSNGAVIYVKDIDMFTEVREKYLLNFVDESVYRTLQQHKSVSPLQVYGEQDLNIQVLETMSVSEGLASEDKILTTEEEIMNFFSYGYDTIEKTYYTTVEGDTVEGVAGTQGQGLTAQMLITLNPEVLTSAQQLLAPGTKINITYFDSPINVVVTKERLSQELIYPEATKYIYDDTLWAGKRVTVQEEVIGKMNVRYYDTYTNGILTDGKEISSVVTVQPVQRIVRIGTMSGGYYSGDATEFNTGSGQLWYPVKNPVVTCHWGCYKGHTGVDIQDRYNHWGLVYASDTGTICLKGYDSISGNYVVIDHHNGIFTYYGHMRVPCWYGVGEDVEQGQPIGNIGMTGYATGPHVHFGVGLGGPPYYHKGGTAVDGCIYLGC